MKKLLYGTIFALCLGTATVSAAPSVNGSTGLINTPSADVLQEGDFSLGYYDLKHDNVGVFNLGLANRLEIGVAGFHYDKQDNETMLNAKLSLIPEKVLIPGLAVGIEDATDEKDRSVYAVASKGLPLGFRIHAGVGNGRYDGLFAGIEKQLSPLGLVTGNNIFPATSLIAEYDGDDMNYGARISIIPGLKVDAGWRNDEAYYGISFTR
ncbi:hypothetical protein SDC9_14670 [bioreactor metagenome]|uniref:Exopolysaccharide biosynthesis protein YbjH n=1 Tax=bioreactor metagenome TaxID=1076179 RepID=A0A644TR50_9ZZZZ